MSVSHEYAAIVVHRLFYEKLFLRYMHTGIDTNDYDKMSKIATRLKLVFRK